MRRFLVYFFMPVAVAAVALATLLMINAGVTVQSNYWEVEGFRRKLALADIAEPKLLVVAGSSAYFGMSAQALERATGLRSVNLGMQAGLSFDLIADLLKSRLKAGDVVLLPLEYTYYGNVYSGIRQRTNTLVASVAWSLKPGFLLTLPVSDWLTFIRHLTFARLWEGVESYFMPPRDGLLLYRVAGIDRWGDNTIDYRDPATPHHLAANLAEELARGLPRVEPDSRRVQDIDKFLNWAQAADVAVLAAFPNTFSAPPFEGVALANLQESIREFWRARGIPLVDDAAAATIAPNQVTDTPYHQSPDGAVARTRRLLQQLCRQTAYCDRQVPHPVPN